MQSKAWKLGDGCGWVRTFASSLFRVKGEWVRGRGWRLQGQNRGSLWGGVFGGGCGWLVGVGMGGFRGGCG